MRPSAPEKSPEHREDGGKDGEEARQHRGKTDAEFLTAQKGCPEKPAQKMIEQGLKLRGDCLSQAGDVRGVERR